MKSDKNYKPLLSRKLSTLLVCLASTGAGAAPIFASAVIKSDNVDSLNTTSAWIGGVLPGAGDVAVFDSTLTASGPFSMGASLSWAGLRVEAPVSNVELSAGFSLGPLRSPPRPTCS